jgi:hypothetical protein
LALSCRQIIGDINTVQKEINVVSEKLSRVEAVADERIFKVRVVSVHYS